GGLGRRVARADVIARLAPIIPDRVAGVLRRLFDVREELLGAPPVHRGDDAEVRSPWRLVARIGRPAPRVGPRHDERHGPEDPAPPTAPAGGPTALPRRRTGRLRRHG